MAAIRDIKRKARGDLHQRMAIPALYVFGNDDPVPCSVRVWLRTDNIFLGDVPQAPGAAELASPEDRVRLSLAEIPAPRRLAVVSVEAGEAYRIDHLYPADLEWQTARVIPLSASEAEGLPLPGEEVEP